MKDKEPLPDKSESGGICKKCYEKVKDEIEQSIEQSKERLVKISDRQF